VVRAHTLLVKRTDGSEPSDLAICQPERGLFGLLDGRPSDVAARCAHAAILEALSGWSKELAGSPESASLLGDALRRANDAILDAVSREPRLRGIGAMAALLGVGPSGWTTAHVGEARVYVAGAAGASLVTQDHTLFNDLVNRGRLREEDFDGFVHPNVIVQALGMPSPLDVRTRTGELPAGGLVLCTAGLWGPVGPKRTLELLSAHASDPDTLFDAFRAALDGRYHPDASAICVTL
jgi:serine/threonine protein phosphatase PrpC